MDICTSAVRLMRRESGVSQQEEPPEEALRRTIGQQT